MKHFLKFRRSIALFFLTLFALEIILPNVKSYALTSGPTQPEVQGFEPISTTDLVDNFSGDLTYNIPLLNIDGYPINIFYHGGVSLEQEASWVGLGWNINAGTINRNVRGIPDDFNGEKVENELYMKEEQNVRVGLGTGAELAGLGEPRLDLSANLNANLNVNNYRGISADFTHGFGVNLIGYASAGLNLGVGSQTGADVGGNASFSLPIFNSQEKANQQIFDITRGTSISGSSGYNSRTGLKDLNFTMSRYGNRSVPLHHGFTIPIGLQNHVPVNGNKTILRTFSGSLSLGWEVYSVYPNLSSNALVSVLKYLPDGGLKAYGYNYLENSDEESMLDFTREKDGMFNETMNFLSIPHLTYDVYNVSGQGISGTFRPFRNDYGSVFDPLVSNEEFEFDSSMELGLGNLFEVGANITVANAQITSGPWGIYKRNFTKKEKGNIYENVFFKNAGELTLSNDVQYNVLNRDEPMNNGSVAGLPLKKQNSNNIRDARGNLTSVLTNEQASIKEASIQNKIQNYKRNFTIQEFRSDEHITLINRINDKRKAHHFSEITQTQMDGTRYVYGIPAMNNYEEEFTFSVDRVTNNTKGIVEFDALDATPDNNKGIENLFNKKRTPAHAHSFLLTSILSSDYVDLTGDGPTDDDLGTYTKFNYSLMQDDYKWKVPYGDNKAQYDPGMKSDYYDDKGSYIQGEREQWYLHSIETKNSIAFFYISERDDARGQDIVNDLSYKLDSVKHFNKNDFLLNGNDAKPIKSVFFVYNYELCKGVLNNINANEGKLTLKEIYIQHGNSKRNLLNPYKFEYYSQGYDYKENIANRWGTYQPEGSPFGKTFEYPFVEQSEIQDENAKAWSLKNVHLPSGGKINIDYESDDYAYVQDKEAMEMIAIKGFGKNKNFTSGSSLYENKYNPNNYVYFKRQEDKEFPNLSFKNNYLGMDSILLTNVNIKVANGKFESIKAYVEVEDIGICPNNTDYGYIKLKEQTPQGHRNVRVQAISYVGINFARRHLSHIIYPGSDPDETNLNNILNGVMHSFKELLKIMTNPVVQLLESNKLKTVKLDESYLRLKAVGLKKKGGGQRVKEIKFFDQWDVMTENIEHKSSYGKKYEYVTLDKTGKNVISSGVASYEPLIGGDENPFRMLDPYIAQSRNKFPPNEPVGLYMEMPMGESLYPSPVVGYSEVKEYSIHKDYAKSAQTLSVYKYYTAKDFPIKSYASTIDYIDQNSFFDKFFNRLKYTVTQHYSLVFNDMHGKVKRMENYKLLPNNSKELISYIHYYYYSDGDELVNEVPVLKTQANNEIHVDIALLGVETDFTHDIREKTQKTKSITGHFNLNTFTAPPVIVPIPLIYSSFRQSNYKFNSSVSNKVIQKYGIIKKVENYDQGALTIVQNEAFDPITGQALITSVNNEYQDRVYNTNFPAYWTENRMGPAYQNIGYEDDYNNLEYQNGKIIFNPGSRIKNYQIGDELILKYVENNTLKSEKMWVTGIDIDEVLLKSICEYCEINYLPNNPDINSLYDCIIDFGEASLILEPRNNKTAFNNANFKSFDKIELVNVRSGYRNQLSLSALEVSSKGKPIQSDKPLFNFNEVIDAKAVAYSESTTPEPYKEDANSNYFNRFNPFINGTKGNFRVYEEYTPLIKRDYGDQNNPRTSGTYNLSSLWTPTYTPLNNMINDSLINCRYDFNLIGWSSLINSSHLFGNTLSKFLPPNTEWVASRIVTKTLPTGEEVENKNPLNIFSAAHFTQPGGLPKLVAQNAKFDEVLFESFEDINTLSKRNNSHFIPFSPFLKFENMDTLGNYIMPDSSFSNNASIVSGIAHTGNKSLKINNVNFEVSIPVKNSLLGSNNILDKFLVFVNKKYLVQYWIKPINVSGNEINYVQSSMGVKAISPIIEGWQLVEKEMQISTNANSIDLELPAGFYIDDLRIYPFESQMKSYVYNSINQRLIASLDENNFATFFEYDEEGNLVRTKKETERGIITLSENRQSHSKY